MEVFYKSRYFSFTGLLTWYVPFCSVGSCSTACLIQVEDCMAFRVANVIGEKRECQVVSMAGAIEKLEEQASRIKIWYSGEITPSKPPCSMSEI